MAALAPCIFPLLPFGWTQEDAPLKAAGQRGAPQEATEPRRGEQQERRHHIVIAGSDAAIHRPEVGVRLNVAGKPLNRAAPRPALRRMDLQGFRVSKGSSPDGNVSSSS
jgi:hypothetical protein